MSDNPGKIWEAIVEDWLVTHGICYDRIPDQVSKLKGSKNVCDYDAYIYPHLYYIECKECASPRFNMLQNIEEYQWFELLKRDQFPGVRAGYAIWMSGEQKAFWVSSFALNLYYTAGIKSVTCDDLQRVGIELKLYQKVSRWYLETFLDVVEDSITQVGF